MSMTLNATAIGAAKAHARHQIPAITSLARSFEGRALKEHLLELKTKKLGGRMPYNIYTNGFTSLYIFNIVTRVKHCWRQKMSEVCSSLKLSQILALIRLTGTVLEL